MRHSTTVLIATALIATLSAMLWCPAAFAADLSDSVLFLQHNCLDCHTGQDAAAGLDLAKFSSAESLDADFVDWVHVVDRVAAGEMPPADAEQPSDADRNTFVQTTSDLLKRHQQLKFETQGRVNGRRLTNLQLERTLHDLLGIDIPLASLMSEEQRTDGFATVAAGQSMSHFQLEQHLKVVDAALTEAFRRATSEPDEWQKEFSAEQIARPDPKRRCREPEMIGDDAVVWASRLIFYGRLPATTAARDGWYRFRIKVSARKPPADRGVWCTVRSGPCISSAPLLSWVHAFEATSEPRELSFEAWLPQGHMLEIRPGDTTLKMGRFAGGQVGTGEGDPQEVPGVNLHALTMERIHSGPSNEKIRRLLFGELPLEAASSQQSSRDRRKAGFAQTPAELLSEHPERDLRQLIHSFATRAFRRPVSGDETAAFEELAIAALDSGRPLLDALRTGYRAVLCSPRFLYFQETAGPLDDYAIASRLSYFLWNSMPDTLLLQLASEGKLHQPDVLAAEVDRMLTNDRGLRFVQDFSSEWLDLRLIDFTEPDPRLYPTFDVIVQQSMLQETHAFLQDMLDQNASVLQLIDSDHTFLNSRLARFYDMPRVQGDELQKVSLMPEDHRGGILTQGAILKVTANGTTTSPVIRGVWIGERLLGEHIPPPPQGVPAIEPDIRGATSIRDLLAKHRSNDSCASCHVKIDPPGFALENYDPAGRFRQFYGGSGSSAKGRRIAVDASYVMSDGRPFENVEQFRALVMANPEKLALNLAGKLITVATGARPQFADRDAMATIVEQSAIENYGIRSIIRSVVQSPVFLSR